jgi:phosphoenolpyruvate-protein kinase (PTS system EI component)
VYVKQSINKGKTMALSEAAIKRNKEANKRGRNFPLAYRPLSPEDKERAKKAELSAKRKKAAIESAHIETLADLDDMRQAMAKGEVDSREAEKAISRFLKRTEVARDLRKKRGKEYSDYREKTKLEDKARAAGVKKYAKGGGVRKARYK